MRLVWFFCFYSSLLFAQPTAWQPITISDGLSQGMVYDLLQDRQGFMWFATKDGLNRYDGYNFKVFTRDTYNPYSISGNTCTALLEDNQGRIWVGTEKDGLNLYDPKAQKFYHAGIRDTGLRNAGNYSIIQLKEDTKGYIWIITSQPGKYFKINPSRLFPNNSNFAQLIEKATVRHQNQVPAFVRDTKALEYAHAKELYPFDPDFLGHLRLSPTTSVLKDAHHTYWVYNDSTMFCMKGQRVNRISFPYKKNSQLVLLNDSTLAFSTQEYLWLLKTQDAFNITQLTANNAFAQFPHSSPSEGSFSVIKQLFQDQQGNLWGTTLGYGLMKFNPRIKTFQSFLPGYSPSYLYQDRQGRVYVHANYRPSYHFYELDKNNNTLKRLPNVTYVNSQGHDALLQDISQHFWLLGRTAPGVSRSLKKYSSNWQFVKEYPIPIPNEVKVASFSIIEGKNHQLWIGYTDGVLLQFDRQSEQFKVHNYSSLLPKNGATVETFALFEDRQGTLWIGTQKGLIKVSTPYVRPTFSIYQNDAAHRQSLSEDFVSGMIDDPFQPNNYLWVSTKGGGLNRLNKSTGHFEHFTEKDGLPNKVVYGVLADNEKNLWVSTNRGIARFHPTSLIFTNFNKSDGIQDDEFNTNAYFKSPSGEILFGGVNGLSIFRPSALKSTQKTPVVRIIGLKINNKSIEPSNGGGLLEQAIEHSTQIELQHNQNQISLEFGVMDLTNPVKNRFRYQLEGIDQEWVEAGTNRFANFSQLTDGSYTFWVQGTTNGEVWSKPASLYIRIYPPFYRSWWAYLLYLILISYVIYRLYQNQLNRVRLQEQLRFKAKEAERLAELDQLKTNFFTNISHEFRTPLTLILGPIEDLVKENPKKDPYALIHRNAQRLLQLINQLLDINKLEAGQMKPETQQVALNSYFRTLTSAFTSLAESNGIDFDIIQDANDVHGFIDKDKVEKIVTNLLTNAFKFTAAGGKVTVKITYSANHKNIEIEVKDTGIGISPEKIRHIFDRFYQADDAHNRRYEGTGIGLALVKELVEVLQGTIHVESEVNKGTHFFVSLPIHAPTWGNALTAPEETPSVVPRRLVEPVSSLITPKDSSSIPSLTAPILLIVDDNADIRAYIRGIFKDDYHIEEAFNGKEGLLKAEEHIPDLVISDLMMPEMDGFEFCRHLKTDDRTSHIPVIMLTAKATTESRIEGFEFGADDYLTKPFNTAEIKARVKNLITIRENLKKHYTQIITETPISLSESHSREDLFLQKVRKVLEKQASHSSFGVEQLAGAMSMSTSQLLRKLKALTNLTTVEFIREYRLQQAAHLLKQKNATVSEVAYQTGFESLSYFTKAFQEKYQVLPSDY